MDTKRGDHWEDEAQFFDQLAEAELSRVAPVHPEVLERYGQLRRRRFDKEYRFRILGDVKGKSVLDVGCGDGINSVTLALLGAAVTGVDVSPKAIELASVRARINNVSASTNFVCAPIEEADLPPKSFDIIWCDAILHHLLHDLDGIVRQVLQYARPAAMVVISEPVNLNRLLRKIRLAWFAPPVGTPDERPMEPHELDIVRARLLEPRTRYYRALGRLQRVLLPDSSFETASRWRRVATQGVAFVDWWLLSVPALRSLSSRAVISGRAP